MQIPHFFLIYFMLLIASTFAIVGWHKSTEGEEHKMPDGTTERTGNIFRAWRFFWMQEHKYKKRFIYQNDSLSTIMREIENFLRTPAKNYLEERPQMKMNVNCVIANLKVVEQIPFLEQQLGIRIIHEPSGLPLAHEQYVLYIYKEEPHYVFPWWLRKMMASCITCHASVYGTIIFAFFHGLFWDTLKVEMYGSVRDITAAVILTWIAYTFSLAYTLTYAYKKA